MFTERMYLQCGIVTCCLVVPVANWCMFALTSKQLMSWVCAGSAWFNLYLSKVSGAIIAFTDITCWIERDNARLGLL